MRKTILLSVAGVIMLGLAGPAVANQNGPRARQPADASGANAGDPDRMICARAEMSGTRIARRVCRTAREWEELGGVPEAR